jgi:hypothetical protein
MPRRAHLLGPEARASRLRVFAGGLLVTGLLLFTWPFVRVPRFHLVPAYLHILGAFTLVVAALFAMTRAMRPPRAPPAPERRGE